LVNLLPKETHPDVLVGYDLSDDAGVYRLSDDLALIQTVDFFTPIVDDPYTFGLVAAANALSDVYAMGGRPITAMNILCFPTSSMDRSYAAQILEGGFDKIHESGAALVGGHSVDDLELKYGLSVSGLVHPGRLITNAGARPGQVLILTKPLGTGIIATAIKGGLASPEAEQDMITNMITLNRFAGEWAADYGVTGGTDITGFGLLGHGLEMARAGGVGLIIESERVPIMTGVLDYSSMGLVPAGSWANQNFCSKHLDIHPGVAPEIISILADAQTSGGLLLAVPQDRVNEFLDRVQSMDTPAAAVIGRVVSEKAGVIMIR
jgi:selenide, water dikinase